jgi:hypothetical protein
MLFETEFALPTEDVLNVERQRQIEVDEIMVLRGLMSADPTYPTSSNRE